MSPRVSRAQAAMADVPLPPLEWTIASDVLAIDKVVESVVNLCAASGFSARQCRFNVPIALTEAMANAILRGNANDASRKVRISSAVLHTRDGATLNIDVTDEGEGFDIEAAGCTPDAPDWLEREDGRGVFLMRSLMDHVECSRSAGLPGNTVRLILHRT